MPTRKSKDYSDKELLQPIIDFFGKHGRAPKSREYNKSNGFPFGDTVYRNRIGNIEERNTKANITSTIYTYTADSIIKIVKPIADFLDRCPTYNEMIEYGKICKTFPTATTVDRHFNNWEDFANSLGYSGNKLDNSNIYSDEELKQCIINFGKSSGGIGPSKKDFSKKNGFIVSYNTYWLRWSKTIEELSELANLRPPQTQWKSREKIAAAIQPIADFLGFCPTKQEIENYCKLCSNIPNTTTIYEKFDNWQELADALGHKRSTKMKSVWELEVLDFIESKIKDTVISGDKKAIGMEIDIYIPSLNIGIECNGNYWHSYNNNRSPKNKAYHLNKTLAANSKGIALCHIWEEEWQSNQKEIKEYLFNFINNIPQEHVGIVDRMKPLNYINSKIVEYTTPELIEIGNEQCWNCGTIIYEEIII